ncbi:MAG TPA: PSD1 and planctomycete cytochrome C domain-containing protein, partial [Verrucomicrobiae bacterium]
MILAFVAIVSANAQSDDIAFFREKIQPILEERCFECHSHKSGKMKGGLTLDSRSGWEAGGEQGAVIVSGQPEKSLLVKAVRRIDPDFKMPPKNPLADNEVALLVDWVKRGAPDPREPPKKNSGNWWSLKPIARPQVPAGFANPIDAFVAVKLKSEGIPAQLQADRRTLIRRLYFDLHGLPPTPEEVDAFVNDSDARAYEKLVDRLLDSPRYGERWARHWMDAIHFADTHGFEHDLIRINAWRYRDYVIESLNRDTPWARFVREQLAPDVFFSDEPQLMVGLGFIGAGPWDQSTAQTAPKTSDYLDRDDIVTQTMSTFASVTVHCARCHDHKFDPITQEDYYGLQAVFAGVGKGDVPFDRDPPIARERKKWKQLIAAADKKDAGVVLSAMNEKMVEEWENSRGPEAEWENVSAEVFTTGSAATLKQVTNGVYIAEGPRPETDAYSITIRARQITAVRLEVLTDSVFPKNGPGRTDNGNLHLSEFDVQLFEHGSDKGHKIPVRRATADFNQDGWTISHAIDGNEKTAWGIFPRVGESHIAVFELEKFSFTDEARLVFQLKQLHGGGHVIGKFRLAVTSDDPSRARIVPAEVSDALKVMRANRSESQRLVVASFALKEIANQRLAGLPAEEYSFGAAPEFRAVSSGFTYNPWPEPKVVNVLHRGDIGKPGAAAKPGAIAAITALNGRFDCADESARRKALADWLADEKNPLTWRSIVNRVWHHHFGRGLVDTLNDFGRMGSEPTHPELLDWLASEFRDSGGSLKALHRLIVTSETYRRSSDVNEKGLAVDPENRL